MSNLTSSGEAAGASVSSNNIYPVINHQQQQYFDELVPDNIISENNQPPPAKKRRNLPGNPDPSAEVIALSPKSLLATNKFVCEICNKGFQRDQNLQLHRRGHNLPWKLKQRTNKEVRKKVYICPEIGCVHHDPLRALGDLTGIKKHFCRKHGEKKWKCEKCSKKYAVQSDWKAHSKTCGTREYRCDCGTLFTRRDSFITHRAFCDALAEESARATTLTSSSNLTFLPPSHFTPSSMPHHHHHHHHHHHENLINNPSLALRQEQQQQQQQLPPWLMNPSSIFSSPLDLNGFTTSSQNELETTDHNPNPSLGLYQLPATSAHMSATALLQKAAQMGATVAGSKTTFALNMCPIEDSVHSGAVGSGVAPHSQLIQDMVNSLSSTSPSPFIGSAFEDHHDTNTTFCGLLTSKKEGSDLNFLEEGMTRDFLGLKPMITNNDFLNFSDHDHVVDDQDQYNAQKLWQD